MLGEEGHGLTIAARRPEKLLAVNLRSPILFLLLKLTPGCVVPEIRFLRPGEAL
jgi:hypothetical protein